VRAKPVKWGLIAVALAYLLAILVIPVGAVVWRAFQAGLDPVTETLTSDLFLHAMWLTLVCTLIAVPLNTIFGVMFAMLVVRRRMRGRNFFSLFADLPLALSPVVIGLSLVLVWGIHGWFGGWFFEHGIRIIFSLPGMVLATIFVSLPFVVREVVPVLRAVGTEQEEAAEVLGASPSRIFWRITLPSIKWGVAYGVILTTARALGEYGAVAVVSGRMTGQTETATIFVDSQWTQFNEEAAFTAALVLAVIAVIVVVAVNLIVRKEDIDGHHR